MEQIPTRQLHESSRLIFPFLTKIKWRVRQDNHKYLFILNMFHLHYECFPCSSWVLTLVAIAFHFPFVFSQLTKTITIPCLSISFAFPIIIAVIPLDSCWESILIYQEHHLFCIFHCSVEVSAIFQIPIVPMKAVAQIPCFA